MSTPKYRLAAPIDSDRAYSPYRTTSSIAFPIPIRLATSNKVEINTSKALLDDRQKVEETEPFIPPARWWLVLPCLLLITLATAADPLLMNDLIVRRYERHYGLDASPNSQQKVCRQSTTTSVPVLYWQFPPYGQNPTQGRPDYNIIQHDAASFHTKNSIVALVPALVTSVLLGSNCDIIGRRPLLVLPFVGKIIWYSLMLIIVSRDLSDGWLLAAHAIEAIFGSSGLVMLSAFSYITDCTRGPMRTRAFLLTEGIVFLARILPVLAVGIWLRFYLYTAPLSVCLALSVIALVYALFIQPESVESVRNVSLIRQLARIRLKPIVRAVTVFTVKRSGSKRQHLALITIVIILLQVVLLGYLSVFSLYLYGRPLCLDALHVSLLSSVHAIIVFLLSMLTAFSKKSLDSTYLLTVLGSLAVIINLIILSFARTIWLLYIAVCIGSLSFIMMPVLRTKLTRLIEADEYAVVFIGAGIIETLGHSAVSAAANRIYNASLNFFPGLIFLIFAITGLFPIAMIGYLAFWERRKSRNTNAIAEPDGDTKA